MKLKHTLFKAVMPISGWHKALKILSVIQAAIVVVLPIAMKDLDTGIWLLNLSLFGFWLSSYAVLRLAYHHPPDQTGIKAWFISIWETAIFICWGLVLIALVILIFKLIFFMRS